MIAPSDRHRHRTRKDHRDFRDTYRPSFSGYEMLFASVAVIQVQNVLIHGLTCLGAHNNSRCSTGQGTEHGSRHGAEGTAETAPHHRPSLGTGIHARPAAGGAGQGADTPKDTLSPGWGTNLFRTAAGTTHGILFHQPSLPHTLPQENPTARSAQIYTSRSSTPKTLRLPDNAWASRIAPSGGRSTN